MNAAAVATALRVLATAVAAEVVVDRPSAVEVYGRGLAPSEVRWLLDGMPDATLDVIHGASPDGENMQLVGTLVGRVVRVLLVGRNHAGLIGDLRQELDRRTQRARAEAGAR